MRLKLIPAKVGRDGKIRLHLLDPRVVLTSILFVAAFVVVLSCHNVSKIEISAENMSYVVQFMMGFGLHPLSLCVGFSAAQVGPLLLNFNVNIRGSAIWILCFLLCLYMFGTQLLLGKLYFDHPWILPFAIFLIVLNLLDVTTYFFFQFVCYLLLDDNLKKVEEKEMLTLQDVEEVIYVSKRISAGLELPGLLLFLLNQLLLVITIFICVAPSSSIADVIGASLIVSVCIILLAIFVFLAEDIYARLRQISAKGRASALIHVTPKRLNVRRLLEFNNKLNELDALVPLTGAGFFNLEKGTISSIVATTLTYSIILMQWKPSTPPGYAIVG